MVEELEWENTEPKKMLALSLLKYRVSEYVYENKARRAAATEAVGAGLRSRRAACRCATIYRKPDGTGKPRSSQISISRCLFVGSRCSDGKILFQLQHHRAYSDES